MIDLSTRLILGHQITFHPSKTEKGFPSCVQDLITLISKVITSRNVRPTIFHSDKGAPFLSPTFISYLKEKNITQSAVQVTSFGNQVIKRWNRTFKGKLRARLKDDKASSKAQIFASLLKNANLNNDELKNHIYQMILQYNSSNHTHLEGVSPKAMEEALLAKVAKLGYPANTPVNSTDLAPFSRNGCFSVNSLSGLKTPVTLPSTSPDIAKIKKYKAEAVEDYKISLLDMWLLIAQNFDSPLKNISSTQPLLLQKMESSKNETINAIQKESDRVKKKQKLDLDGIRLELKIAKEKIAFLTEAKIAEELEKYRNELCRDRIKNRNRLPAQDATAFSELRVGLELINNSLKYRSEYTRSRDKLALVLLFFTSFRLSNLLHINSNHLKFLLDPNKDKGPFVVTAIKSRSESRVHHVHLDSRYYELITTFKSDIDILQKGKQGIDLVFTSKNSTIGLNRTSFNKRTNKILKKVSRYFHKNKKATILRFTHIDKNIESVYIENE